MSSSSFWSICTVFGFVVELVSGVLFVSISFTTSLYIIAVSV